MPHDEVGSGPRKLIDDPQFALARSVWLRKLVTKHPHHLTVARDEWRRLSGTDPLRERNFTIDRAGERSEVLNILDDKSLPVFTRGVACRLGSLMKEMLDKPILGLIAAIGEHLEARTIRTDQLHAPACCS
jgi:hypothetical protein